MDKNLDRTVKLFQRAQLRQLTPEEQKELEELLSDSYLAGVYQDYSKSRNIADKLEEYKQYPTGKAYQEFCVLCAGHKSRHIYRYIVGIAALLVLALGMVFLLYQRQESKVEVAAGMKQTIAPGKPRAILRLMDGSMIPVGKDSVQIEEKNGARVQYANGKISYQATAGVVELAYNELIVPRAGECFISLEDGTRVWINSDSRLKYPVKFTGEERKVYLEGEAYFEVVKDAKPFIVNTTLGDIKVLGTSFNVKAYQEEDKMAATLVSGKICYAGVRTLLVSPGEQVTALADGSVNKQVVDVEEFVGWKDGVFVFKNQRLEDIMKDLARWYDVKVFYQQPALKDIEFTGNLKRYDEVNVFMELLRSTNELNYSIDGNTIILYQ